MSNKTDYDLLMNIREDIFVLEKFPLAFTRAMGIRKKLRILSTSPRTHGETHPFDAAWILIRNLSVQLHNSFGSKRLSGGTIWHLHNILREACL